MDPLCHYHRIPSLFEVVPSKLNNASSMIFSLKSSFLLVISFFLPLAPDSWSSPRPISTSQLHALLHFHLWPIYHLVFVGSYCFRMGYLISRGASRLDAFSVYPCRTWLPSRAFGKTTGAPVVRPSRSSRTKDSSSQISSARDR